MKNLKNQLKFKKAFLVICLFTSSILFSQEKPYRIGIKIGFPNLIGGNVEYVTPFLNKKLALTLDYSAIKADNFLDPDKGKFSYFSAGLNYYFLKEGKSLYGNLSYGSFNGKGTTTDVESENGAKTDGVGNIDFSSKSLNIMVGAKLGGLFYFRPEIGFALSGFPKSIDMNVKFSDGSSEVQNVANSDDIPGILSSGLMFNLGFGFSF